LQGVVDQEKQSPVASPRHLCVLFWEEEENEAEAADCALFILEAKTPGNHATPDEVNVRMCRPNHRARIEGECCLHTTSLCALHVIFSSRKEGAEDGASTCRSDVLDESKNIFASIKTSHARIYKVRWMVHIVCDVQRKERRTVRHQHLSHSPATS